MAVKSKAQRRKFDAGAGQKESEIQGLAGAYSPAAGYFKEVSPENLCRVNRDIHKSCE
jgi:hypothetical protein